MEVKVEGAAAVVVVRLVVVERDDDGDAIARGGRLPSSCCGHGHDG